MKTTDDQLSLRIPSDLKQAIQDAAKAKDRSSAWIVIQAIKAYLNQRGKSE